MLEVERLSKSFAGFIAVSDVSLTVAERQIAAVIGPNGAGKSTLFNLITGHLRPDSRPRPGSRTRHHRRGAARDLPHGDRSLVPAHQHLPEADRVRERAGGVPRPSRPRRQFLVPLGKLLSRRDRGPARIDRAASTRRSRRRHDVSYGNQKQLELGLALASDPQLLLLDEPTAGMSAGETHETIRLLRAHRRERGLTLLFTEHDMEVVFSHRAEDRGAAPGPEDRRRHAGGGARRSRGAPRLSGRHS